ncbi:transposase [Streptomyces sp. FXJ1.4098]|nr:transposase [Streptomyces sp. FXJ1.4098]
MTEPVHQALHRRGLLPGEHYLDSGYSSAELVAGAHAAWGITLITPLRNNTSAQARARAGYAAEDFTIDYDQQHALCPQGHTSRHWSATRQRNTQAIVIQFATDTCLPCPVRDQCTTSQRRGRQLTVRPREVHEILHTARTEQPTLSWQARYALRAGVEGTIHQAIAVTGNRRARYRGLAKTHLEHVYSAVALNLIRLDAWWNGHPLDRTRTTHLTRLELTA